MSEPKFKIGDIVDWDQEYLRGKFPEYSAMPGPFAVIREGPYKQLKRFRVVSLRRADGFEPRHTGTGDHGEPAPYGGNNWADHFFKRDEFLTAVYARKRVRRLAQRKSNLRTQLTQLPQQGD